MSLYSVALRFLFTETKGRVSPAPVSNGGELYTTPANAWHGDLRLVCGCSGMEIASRGSLLVSVATEDTRQSHSVSLCDLPLCVCAVVAPRRYHFTMTALTVYRGSSSRADILRTDLLDKWHPMTVPCGSSVRPFYCQCLSMEIACLCAQFYTCQIH